MGDYQIGLLMVVARVDHAARTAFVHEDRPVTVRRNKHGNPIRSDLRCIQTLVA